MRINSIEYYDTEDWKFSEVHFKSINLFVGASSSGKSRLLNILFNIARFVVSKEIRYGYWNITFEQGGKHYRWELASAAVGSKNVIALDNIWVNDELIIKRDDKSFIFKNESLPKLPKDQTSITLLSEEDLIKPIYNGFSYILRRNFDQSALLEASILQSIPQNIVDEIEQDRKLVNIFLKLDHVNLNSSLYFLNKYFKADYSLICDYYRSVFPFISDISIMDINKVKKNISIAKPAPVFCIKEKNVNKWITLDQFSSGMKKILLILTDICMIPEGGIYLIDEYENSLGINAIEFLPTFLLEYTKDIQFFITSHHPYIINKIPIENWYIFHRKGGHVTITRGDELSDKFSKSKQQAFIQLINDPIYAQGVE